MTALEEGGQRPLRIPSGEKAALTAALAGPPAAPGAAPRAAARSSALPPVSAVSPVSPDGSRAPVGAPHRRGPGNAPRPLRPTSGYAGSGGGWRDLDNRLLAVVGRLTERDRLICRLLDAHRVLTAVQVADACFTGQRRARMRLGELHALGVLDRFRPRRTGQPVPFHYVLGPLGAAITAAEAGLDPAGLAWRRRDAAQLAASQRLAHLVGINGFFCALLRSARSRPGCQLQQWWSERRCAAEWGEVVRPDGYAVWCDRSTAFPFLYEHDNATERLDRLAAKLDGYAHLAQAAGHPNWVLFTFPTPRREADARRVLTHPNVPVATTARSGHIPPDGPVWLPAAATGTARLRLVELAEHPHPAA